MLLYLLWNNNKFYSVKLKNVPNNSISHIDSGDMIATNMWYSVIPTWRRNKCLMYNICSCNYTADYYIGLVTHQTKKKRDVCSLFLSWKEFLFFLSSSSSTRHIIYHYKINDKFFEHFKTRLLFQMDNYSAQHFYVSYFHFLPITYCNFFNISLQVSIFALNLSAV
jgi:hypothetical protein